MFGAGLGRQLVEAAAKRTLGVDIGEEQTLRSKLVEAVQDLRLADRANRRLGMLILGAASRFTSGQDADSMDRLSVADRVRSISRVDSHLFYAVRLRIAFCFGRGVTPPKANDDEVQVVLDDFWKAPANRAEITSAEAQWRFGKDLFEVCNVYTVVFADGMDGRVLLAGLQHDQVVDVVRDPKVWGRVLWYVVKEFVYEWDFEHHRPKPNPKQRTVYYEAFDGFEALEVELKQGRAMPASPSPTLIRPGRILHTAINRGREQAFGEPEMRTNLRWAASFADLLAGQVEKARAAQQYLVKITAQGASTEQALTDAAMRAVGRRSPLSASFEDLVPDPDPDLPRPARPGSQWWQNEAMNAEPFTLDAGSSNAKQDMDAASAAFATGTNFPAHYFTGDPGSLAGAMAVELPVLKLTDIDQEVALSPLRKLCDLRIARAIKVGLLTERREPTEEEMLAGAEVDADGLVERDLTYQLNMPEALRRNLPELMALATDTQSTWDPMGQSEPLQRALLGFVFSELLDFPDSPALIERIFAEQEQPMGGGEAEDDGTDPTTSTGPDGKQHPPDNPMGAKRQSAAVESALAVVWARLQDPEDVLAVELGERLIEAATITPKPHDIPNAFGQGQDFGRGGRFLGKFHPGGMSPGAGRPKSIVHRLADKAVAAVKAGANKAFPNAEPRYDDSALAQYEAQEIAYALADPGAEPGAEESWLKDVKADARRANSALNAALGPDLAKYIDRKWGREAGVRRDLLDGKLTIDDATDLAYEQYMEGENRRAQRENLRDLDYGLNRKSIPCFSCGRFKKRPSDVCGYCGDDPVPTASGSSSNRFASETAAFDRAYGYGGN